MIKVNKKMIFIITCIVVVLFIFTKSFARTSLFIAIDEGDCKKVERIIKVFPSLLNSQEYGVLGCIIGVDNSIDTPLVRACYKKQPEIVKLLVNLGADVNSPSLRSVRYPIITVLNSNDYELAWLFIENGADLSVVDDYKLNVASSVLTDFNTKEEAKQQYEIMKLYIESGHPIHWKSYGFGKMSLLGESVVRNNTFVIEYFLKNKIFNVNDPVIKGTKTTALIQLIKFEIEIENKGYYADKYRDTIGVCELLLEYGADKTITDDHGKTAYDYAIELGDQKLLELLS